MLPDGEGGNPSKNGNGLKSIRSTLLSLGVFKAMQLKEKENEDKKK